MGRRELLTGLFDGDRPDITPAQAIAVLLAGVPILAQLLHAFGIYSMSLEQQDALSNAVTWMAIVAGSLIGGDAVLRSSRNARKGRVEAVLAEGGEDLAITHEVMLSDDAAALASIPQPTTATTYMSPEDVTQVMDETGFEEPPPRKPPPIRRRKRG